MEATKKHIKRDITIEYFTKKSESVENYKDYILIFQYKSERGLPCAAILRNREAKPSLHYQFRNESERVDFINRQKTSADNDIEREAIRHAERMKEAEKFVKGAILYSSWGYEQTNIDFYEILERKNDFVIIQEIGQIRNHDSRGDSGTCMPDKKIKIGEPFRKKITKHASINLESYKYCGLWNGRPLSWSSYA